MIYYPKRKISQKKIQNIVPDQNKYVNLETGEVLDLLETIENQEYLFKLKYKFIRMNKEIPYKKLVERIGITYFGYLCLLITNLKADNTVDLEILGLKNAGLNKFKGIMKKNGILKYLKLKDMKKGEYFLNPIVSAYNTTVRLDLYQQFQEESNLYL